MDRLRIGCYALVERDAGSVASANYLLIQALLARGHALDLYAIRGYVEPEGFDAEPNYRYVGLRGEAADRLEARLARLPEAARALGGRLVHRLHLDAIGRAATEAHRRDPYDVFLFLGVPAQFAVGEPDPSLRRVAALLRPSRPVPDPPVSRRIAFGSAIEKPVPLNQGGQCLGGPHDHKFYALSPSNEGNRRSRGRRPVANSGAAPLSEAMARRSGGWTDSAPSKNQGGPPLVSWVQGPPGTEWAAIQSRRDEIVRLCGRALYEKLRLFYALKARQARREARRGAVVVCGSTWSVGHVVASGMSPERAAALPYPVDLDLFRPTPEPPEPGHLLWLGRVDPRKRLDLMLDALRLLIESGEDVRLTLAGRVGYAAGYRRMIDAFPYPDRLRHVEHVPRADVPALIQSAAVVVQPSEAENFGSAVAEALACNRPVVLGPTNGTGDYVGAFGHRFERYTPEAVADAIRAALRAGPPASRDHAERTFAPEAVAAALDALLHRAAGRPVAAEPVLV